MRRNLLWTALVAVVAIAGCGPKAQDGQNGTSSNSGKKFKVIFSQCNNAEPYRSAQNDLMTSLWAKKPDIDFSIQDAGAHNEVQISQIRTIIKLKPDLLIVAPNDSAPLTEPVQEAFKAGIPVIVLERNVNTEDYTTYIRCDNLKIGQMAGEFIVDYLTKKYGKPQGNIVQLHGISGNQPEKERNNGAQEMYGKYPDIKVVGDGQAKWIQNDAYNRMTEMLSANPKIDVVYGHNDPMAIGAYLAAKEKGREKDMIFIGVDGLPGDEGGISKVLSGQLAVTFIYPLCVDKAVEIGYKILTDKTFKPDKEYMMHSEKVTKENAQKLLDESKEMLKK